MEGFKTLKACGEILIFSPKMMKIVKIEVAQ